MRDQVARGVRAGVAADMVRTLLSQASPGVPFVKDFLDASDRLNPVDIVDALEQARLVLGLAGCLDGVLFPGMQRIGSWWESGRCELRQEQLTTETVLGWLTRLGLSAPMSNGKKTLLLTCGPSDLHTIGLEAFGVLLRYQHWNCRFLRTPAVTSALSTAIRTYDALGVVVVSHLGAGRKGSIQSIRAVASMSLPVFYAGSAFASTRSRYGLPGQYLGTNLHDAGVLLDSTFKF